MLHSTDGVSFSTLRQSIEPSQVAILSYSERIDLVNIYIYLSVSHDKTHKGYLMLSNYI